MAATILRRCTTLLAILAASVAVFLAVPATPASADPEGGTAKLRAALESAAKGHVQAKQRLAVSRKRQGQLVIALKNAEAAAARLSAEVGAVAGRSYRMGRISTVTLLLTSGSTKIAIERLQSLDMLAKLDSVTLDEYRQQVDDARRAKIGIDAEVREQAKQVIVLAKKKRQAEEALASVGGGGPSGGFIDAKSPAAKPAPRNSDGSWPKESCTVKDPTTSGCVTPRTLHAYQEAQAAGFKRYTDCFSQRSSGEHPKGRACDFSAAAGGFKNVDASGGDKAYGDRLAAFFVKNADRLGVMYVIWYREIWMPGDGWKRYSGSGGPSATHTNHVHLSML